MGKRIQRIMPTPDTISRKIHLTFIN